jgi:hypothetical protein
MSADAHRRRQRHNCRLLKCLPLIFVLAFFAFTPAANIRGDQTVSQPDKHFSMRVPNAWTWPAVAPDKLGRP